MVQKRETKAINKLCVREILSLSFVCGAYFFEFRGRNLVCFGIAYNFDWGRHMQIRAESREGTHAHCVFHACRLRQAVGPVLSRSEISHGQAEERRHFFNGDLHTVLSYYFGCRLLGWKSIRA